MLNLCNRCVALLYDRCLVIDAAETSVKCLSDTTFNILRPRQNGRHFADDIFKSNSWMKMFEFRLKYHWSLFLKDPINNILALVQIMAWCRPGDKPLSEAMMVSLPTHTCVTRPQWVLTHNLISLLRYIMRSDYKTSYRLSPGHTVKNFAPNRSKSGSVPKITKDVLVRWSSFWLGKKKSLLVAEITRGRGGATKVLKCWKLSWCCHESQQIDVIHRESLWNRCNSFLCGAIR